MDLTAPILVTGDTGQVGSELLRALSILGPVVSTNRCQIDLSKPDSIRHHLHLVRPSVIVNAAAYTAVDKAESEEETAFAINAEAVAVLGEEAAKLAIPVIHYSTDYVFPGTGEHFHEESEATDPVNVYGRSKLAGEKRLLAANPQSWILRTSWVYSAIGNNFLRTMLRLWQTKPELRIVADQYGVPTSAALIADITALLLYRILDAQPHPEPGIYHLAPAGTTTWHGFAQCAIECAVEQGLQGQFAPADIQAIATSEFPTAAKRPLNSRLDCTKLETSLGISLPPWQNGVDYVVKLLINSNL